MHRKAILNRVERYKSFVYGGLRWIEEPGYGIEVPIEARAT